jgi:hypothetical protein
MTWITEYSDNSVYVPGTLQPGTAWQRIGTFDTTIDNEDISFTLTETLDCTSVENISIEAGEFEAYRIEYTTEKSNDDESYTSNGVSWYVPGLGRILTESNARLELIQYQGIEPAY